MVKSTVLERKRSSLYLLMLFLRSLALMMRFSDSAATIARPMSSMEECTTVSPPVELSALLLSALSMLAVDGVNCGWRVLVNAAEADADATGIIRSILLKTRLGVMLGMSDSRTGGSSDAFGASESSVKPGEAAATSEETSARCSLSVVSRWSRRADSSCSRMSASSAS